MTQIAIVILNWNGVHHLRNFLPSVIQHSVMPGTKIIVADNHSTDASMEMLKNEFPEVDTVILDENFGFAGGYNKALKQIQAKYYVLLNSDIEVTENWLQPMFNLLESDTTIAACQPKIRSYHQKDYFEYAGASGGYIDRLGYPFCRGRILSEIEMDQHQYDNRARIFWATGACLMVRSEVYHQLGGLDPDFFAHMEEIDLCWRIQNSGFSIYVEPAAMVYHVGGGTLPNNNPRKLYLNYRNSLFMLYKNLPANLRIPVIFTRMVLDGASGMVYLLQGNLKFVQAVLNAHFDFYRHIPRLARLRKNASSGRKYPSTVYRGVILKEFFFKKRTTFSAIDKKNIADFC